MGNFTLIKQTQQSQLTLKTCVQHQTFYVSVDSGNCEK